jgi:hypothetical protein
VLDSRAGKMAGGRLPNPYHVRRVVCNVKSNNDRQWLGCCLVNIACLRPQLHQHDCMS